MCRVAGVWSHLPLGRVHPELENSFSHRNKLIHNHIHTMQHLRVSTSLKLSPHIETGTNLSYLDTDNY